MDDDLTALRELLTKSRAMPVMFVGSGLSRRYIGSPDWDGLLEHFADLAGKNFAYYRGRAGGDRPKAASMIAEDFYDIWWNSDDYAQSRTDSAHLVSDTADPLKIEICKHIGSLGVLDRPEVDTELDELSKIHCHAIITTNWDEILDDAFPEMEVYVGQNDVLFSSTQTVGEIYKIHGSITDPRSLVFTEADYERYWDANPYLIAKILTLFVENPIIFIGYSLGDPHIQRLLGNLVTCLSEGQLDRLNERFIFVGRPDERRREGLSRSSITVQSHTFGVNELGLHDYGDLYRILSELPQHFPYRLLRQLRESVFQLAYGVETSDRIHVLDFDADTDVDQVEVVIGVGTMARIGLKGYSSLTRVDLFNDMLAYRTDHDADQLLSSGLKTIFKSAKFAPIHYPLYLARRAGRDVATLVESLPPRARSRLGDGTLKPYPGSAPANWQDMTFRELLAIDPKIARNRGVGCRYEIDDVVALRHFLSERFAGATTNISTDLAKLGCKYDQLVFGDDFDGDRHALLLALDVPAITP
ncbi:SIR2 family protein [Mycobacterium sp. GA-2829]|uniref:SIR2 family protein n=1 Tax=Mycobacterium sp. GA-2829 TaxID=1772283 RepID=UPI0009EAA3C2|nr:SIR2 family protein [Mycobacterium sp. GA-2829]